MLYLFLIILAFIISPKIYSLLFKMNGGALPRSKTANITNEKFYKPPGEFIQLSFGETHYIYKEPKKKGDSVIVLVHGFSASSRTFQFYVDGLSDNGFGVLTYDHYGSGFSSAPDVKYNAELMTNQLYELITKVVQHKNVWLCGQSMGGALVTHYLSVHPETVSGAILLVPAGMPVNKPLIANLLHIPYVGDFLFPIIAPKIFEKNVMTGFTEESIKRNIKMIEMVRDSKNYLCEHNPSFLQSALSVLKHYPLGEMESSYKKVGQYCQKNKFPIHIFMAENDNVIPMRNKALFENAMPTAKIDVLKGVGHLAFIEIKEELLEKMTSIVKQN
eukprot:TRINITY_DN803_c0_g1_i4.p1 TRINITY_DN803_c0_g1~~TRINITY_DN803_c0_g1_i4.p1  ORF type:complete len:331 (+),score=72.18 TRINITY_DN803_c0_g1_i4:81-1073(+)